MSLSLVIWNSSPMMTSGLVLVTQRYIAFLLDTKSSTSSILVATDLVRDGRACAVVSAGNSGAAMGAATLRLGLLPGVDRPAIAMLLPSRSGAVVVLDVGATC